MAIAHKGFILQSSLFSTSRLLCALLSVSRSFLIARWLGPTTLGMWQFIQIFERYSSYASLGTRSAMSRKVPYLRGKGSVRESESILNNAFAANFIGTVIYSIAVFAYSFLVEESQEANALASYAVVILLSSWFGFNSVVFMSLGQYTDINRIEIAEIFIATLSVIAFSYFYGIYGIIFGFFLSRLIAFALSSHRLWDHFKFEVDCKILMELIRTGIPMMIISILVTTMAVADRILIASMLSREMLGMYGVANVGIYVIRTASTSIGQLFLVKFSEMHGQNRSVKNTADALVLLC
jgi:O-antigen/teichoic acid export membrane protein